MAVRLDGESDGAKYREQNECQLLNLSTFEFHSSLEASKFFYKQIARFNSYYRMHKVAVSCSSSFVYVQIFTIPFPIASYY